MWHLADSLISYLELHYFIIKNKKKHVEGGVQHLCFHLWAHALSRGSGYFLSAALLVDIIGGSIVRTGLLEVSGNTENQGNLGKVLNPPKELLICQQLKHFQYSKLRTLRKITPFLLATWETCNGCVLLSATRWCSGAVAPLLPPEGDSGAFAAFFSNEGSSRAMASFSATEDSFGAVLVFLWCSWGKSWLVEGAHCCWSCAQCVKYRTTEVKELFF